MAAALADDVHVDEQCDRYAARRGLLRGALEVWQAVAAPYEVARVRVLIGRACGALADSDGAELEFAAARAAFDDLGAAPDVARVEDIVAGRQRGESL